MKKLYTFLVLLVSLATFAQAPEGFNYQATIRNSAGTLITNKSVNFTFSIIKDSPTGIATYTETQTVTTDDLGATNLVVGKGTPTTGTFSAIDWSTGTYYLSILLNTGSGNVAMGTTQLLSVPYALYAKSAGQAINQGLSTLFITGNITNAQASTQIAAEAGPNTQNVVIENTSGLTNVDLSGIRNLENININDNTDLTNVSFNGLTKVFRELNINNNPKLTSLAFPALTVCENTTINGNSVLTSVSVPLFKIGDGYLDFSGNALSSSVINTLLHQLLSLSPSTGKNILLNGQTPAAPPTGQGVTDMNALIANGNNVTADKGGSSLELTIKDELGAVVSGVAVKLFATINDLSNGSNPVATATSDATGKAKFDNLNAIIYYFDATKGCKSNAFSPDYKTTASLVANTTTKMDVKLTSIGTVTVTNASTTDSYNLYLTLTGPEQKIGSITHGYGGSGSLNLPTGIDIVFRAVKLINGVESTVPADIVTKIINLTNCGNTATFTFGS